MTSSRNSARKSAPTAPMFSRDDLFLLRTLEQEYAVLIANCHDIRLRSNLTGHEWIVVSPYDGSSCEILHRHSGRDSFHHQRGPALPPPARAVRLPHGGAQVHRRARKVGRFKKERPTLLFMNIIFEHRDLVPILEWSGSGAQKYPKSSG